MRIALVLTAALALACEAERSPPVPEVTLSTDEWPPAGPLPTEVPEDEPFDVRLIRLDPTTHADQERVCDVSWAGRLTRVSAAELPRYPQPISKRRLIRCRAATGEGWADLVFDADSAALANYVETGDRIRVRVLPGRGFENHPLLAFVAAIDHVALPPRREEPVPVGAAFERPERDRDRVYPCAVAYVGGLEPLEGDGDESHRAPIRCRHASGSDWVELRFPEITAASALRLARGVIVPVRLVSNEGGEAGLPVGRYEGP